MEHLIHYDEGGRPYSSRGWEVALSHLAWYETAENKVVEKLGCTMEGLLDKLEQNHVLARGANESNLAAYIFHPRRAMIRLVELDELYTKIQVVSGYTAEQLLDLLLMGYSLCRPPEGVGVKIKELKLEGSTPEELVHQIRSLCCVIFADDDEIKIHGELAVYVSGSSVSLEGMGEPNERGES